MSSNMDFPWLKHYDSEVSHHLRIPNNTLVDVLKDASASIPEKVCLVYHAQRFTYLDIDRISSMLAEILACKGLTNGDRVGILLGNSPAFVVSFFAVLKAGGVVTAINPNYKKPEIQYIAQDSGLTYLITGEKDEVLATEIQTEHDLSLLLMDDIGQLLNWPREQDLGGAKLGQNHKKPQRNENRFELPELSPEDPAIFQYSGGTTGVPKAAVGLHRNLVANVIQFREWLNKIPNPNPVFLCAIPFYHVYGMVLAMCLPIYMRATLIVHDRFQEMDSTMELINQFHPDVFPCVPGMFRALMKSPYFNALEQGALNICISGSAPLEDAVKNEFETKTGAVILEGYGLSEAPTATHCNPLVGIKKAGSIGLPLPDVECQIVDLENSGIALPKGQVGELILRGPQVMQAYHNREFETRITIRNGWLHTGDTARMDADGYFYITGRIKDLIKVSGFQVWPGEVENVIRGFPGINDVVVAGIHDEETGERPKAWIITNDREIIDFEELREYCRGFLADYKVPKEYELIEEFPRSNIGKVLRRELIRMDREKKHPG